MKNEEEKQSTICFDKNTEDSIVNEAIRECVETRRSVSHSVTTNFTKLNNPIADIFPTGLQNIDSILAKTRHEKKLEILRSLLSEELPFLKIQNINKESIDASDIMMNLKDLDHEVDKEGCCSGLTHTSIQALLSGSEAGTTIKSLNDHLTDIAELHLEPAVFNNRNEPSNFNLFYKTITSYQKTQGFGEALKKLPIICAAPPIIGSYEPHTLLLYLKSLKRAFNQTQNPNFKVALELSNLVHSTMLGYDKQIDMWYFIDLNQLPVKELKTERAVVGYILEAQQTIDFKQKRCFCTKAYISKADTIAPNWDVDARKLACAYSSPSTELLCIALRNGDEAVAKTLINAKVDVNQGTANGLTPIYIASQFGYGAVVEILINAKADVNKARSSGSTPLLIAAGNGHTTVVETLINAKADVNKGAANGATPLYIAIERGHEAVAKALINAKTDVNKARSSGATPLYIAASRGYTAIVLALIDAKADVNKARSDGASPLLIATQKGHEAIVKILSEAATDPEFVAHDSRPKPSPILLSMPPANQTLPRLLSTIEEKTSNHNSPRSKSGAF